MYNDYWQFNHVGLSAPPELEIWRYALENDLVVVTTNARDFIRLLNVEVHAGLMVLRESGLSRDEQWARLSPLIEPRTKPQLPSC